MKKIPSVVIFGLFSVMLQMSCSVKEDRSSCPCRLNLDFGRVDTSVVREIELNLATTDGYLFSERIEKREFDIRTYLVPKSYISIMVLSQSQDFLKPGMGLIIPIGKECPPVYSFIKQVSTTEEVVDEVVVLRKNFCNVFIEFIDFEHYNYDLKLKGNVNGYGLDGNILVGLFEVPIKSMIDEVFSIRIPRQKDSSLLLVIGDGMTTYKSFALGEYIMESGYDWTAPDLNDIVVQIDYSRTELFVSVQPWEKSEEIETII